MTITLFYSPGACSISPHVALRESGLPFEIVKVDLGKKTYGPDGADYLKVCPKGYVPAVRLGDGQMLTENAVMIQYIADLVPEKNLAPTPGTFERVRFAELLNFIATELHKGMSPMYNAKAGDEYKVFLKDRLTKRFLVLDEQLGERPWLWGDRFTVADGYASYVLRAWKRVVKAEIPGKHLNAYYERLLARPSVRDAMAAEGIEP